MTRCIVCNSDFPESLALCPICGFVPDASKLEDPKADPNIPDLREYWCRACRGHHGTFLSGVGDDRTRKCKDCSSGDVHLVNFNITKAKVSLLNRRVRVLCVYSFMFHIFDDNW